MAAVEGDGDLKKDAKGKDPIVEEAQLAVCQFCVRLRSNAVLVVIVMHARIFVARHTGALFVW